MQLSGSLFDQTDYAKVLFYGPQGTGKTTDLASLAHLGKTIVVNAEGGLKKKPLTQLGIPVQNIVPVKCADYNELDALYWQIKANLDDHEPDDPERVAGLGFDSMTEITKILVGNAVERRVEKATKKNTAADSPIMDPFYTDRDDYGRMTQQARQLTRRFRDLDCHVAFTALEKRDSSSGELVLLPNLTPAFSSDLMGYVDMVIYKAVVDVDGRSEFVGVTRPVGKYQGKDRYGVTPPVMAFPTMDRLIALINDKLDLSADSAQLAYAARMARDAAGVTESTEPDTQEPDTDPAD